MRGGNKVAGEADNQQGSRNGVSKTLFLTPQRLRAELLAASALDLECYLQGALRDGTRSALHGTHRIGQADPRWLKVIEIALSHLGYRSWTYREGQDREFWIVETTASFLSVSFDASNLVETRNGLAYVRGYFDAEGGMPRDPKARLYFQFSQKDLENLSVVRRILEFEGIDCGRIHNPSYRVDPHYWRFFVLSKSHERFMELIRSWHPRKRQQIETRMKI